MTLLQPNDFEVASGTPDCTVDQGANTISCEVGAIEPGQSKAFSMTLLNRSPTAPRMEEIVWSVSTDGTSGADTFSDPDVSNNGFSKTAQVLTEPPRKRFTLTARQRRTQELGELATRIRCSVACQVTARAKARVAGQLITSQKVIAIVNPGTVTTIRFRFAKQRLAFLDGKGGTATLSISAISAIGEQKSTSESVALRLVSG